MILSIALITLKDSFLPPFIVLLRMKDASKWGLKISLQIVIKYAHVLIKTSIEFYFLFKFFIIVSLIGASKMMASIFGLFGITHRTRKLMLVVSN